ncbi:hypothetical protein V2A60_003190 [Cordyceps javanica]|uniref:Protein-arginine deiminase n=1 Tax=Cordyceps javanica TaxID=43265 RepID=A0A545V3W7_9HYPO|nr:protein-arginine deiminase [Cordyceps javanica]TQW07697.1 protein-arginine deiminase [Cordyceps javanica]
MMKAVRVTSVLLLGFAGAAQALQPVILADTNRDGHIDLIGDSDSVDKETWTEQRGALFLANIGDSGQRCSRQLNLNITRPTPGEPPEQERQRPADDLLDKCHDASDNVQRNPKYLAPVATLPLADVGDSASGTVTIVGEAASKQVRVFQRDGSDWRFISANHTFSAGELRSGLSLGIDARDVRRPDAWDGRVTLQFSVRDGASVGQDSVVLRVAPILTHHHLQKVTEVIANIPGKHDPFQNFITQLGDNTRKAGVEKPLRLLDGISDWAQDRIETGYMSMPGPSGPVTLRVVIRVATREPDGQVAFTQLRSDTVGAVQIWPIHESDDSNADDTSKEAGGNLETIPPYEYQGRVYPAGRTFMGSRYGSKPKMSALLAAQESQPMVELETSWLGVGHVDEFMQFLPVQSERGWVMAIQDPSLALELFQKLKADGHGNVKAVSRPHMPYDKNGAYGIPPLTNKTVSDVLNLPVLERIVDYAARHIQKNVDIVKRETGVTDQEIIRVPGFFYNETFEGKRTYQRIKVLPDPEDEEESLKSYETACAMESLYPSSVNGLLFSATHYLAPNPWGPVVDGKDILQEAVLAAYAATNLTVSFMDDWYSHHVGVGDIHCGSNVFREPTPRWW